MKKKSRSNIKFKEEKNSKKKTARLREQNKLVKPTLPHPKFQTGKNIRKQKLEEKEAVAGENVKGPKIDLP